MRGPTTVYMPKLCDKCNTRAQQHVIEFGTGNIVEVCPCERLYDRTKCTYVASVVFKRLDGVFRLYQGGLMKEVKPNEVARLWNELKAA